MLESSTTNDQHPTEPLCVAHPVGLDPAIYAVLEECRHRSIGAASLLCRRLDQELSVIEAVETVDQRQLRASFDSYYRSGMSTKEDEPSGTQLGGTAESTDQSDISFFIPVVDPDSDDSVSHTGAEMLSNRSGFDGRLDRPAKDGQADGCEAQRLAPLAHPGFDRAAEKVFPYPNARWECGTFLGKRVFIDTTSAVLGRGATAAVLAGTLFVTATVTGAETVLTSIPVAVKAITYDARLVGVRNMCERAVQLREEVSHPGITHTYYLGTYYPPFGKLSTMQPLMIHSSLVLARSETGSTAEALKRTGPFLRSETQRCVVEVLTTLRFLHEEHNRVHNDIKPHNILIFGDPAVHHAEYKYQLTDFATLAMIKSPEVVMREIQAGRAKRLASISVGGTAAYMSPESCLGLGELASNDIWSLGITAYHLATGTLPWKPMERQYPSMILNGYRNKYSLQTIFGDYYRELVNSSPAAGSACVDHPHPLRIDSDDLECNTGSASGKSTSASDSTGGGHLFRDQYEDYGPILEEFEHSELPGDFRDFVLQCLIENPLDRPTARELLDHPFVKGVEVGAHHQRGL